MTRTQSAESAASLEHTRGTRVLVTGAAGFIGSHLVDMLLAGGATVVAVDRRSPADDPVAAANLADAIGSLRLTVVTADLRATDMSDLVAGCDTVFHLAGIPGVHASWGERFTDYVETNVIATQRLLDVCHGARVRRLVMASSSSVYGPASRPSSEDDPVCPVSPYGVTKLAAEQLCLAYVHRADSVTSVVALRYFTVYGPRQRQDMAVARALDAALTGTPFPMFGGGSQRRELTYVTDVVAATVAAAAADARGVAINVGGGSRATMRDVVHMAGEVTGGRVPVTILGAQPGDVPSTAANAGRSRRLLGYQPRVGLREGIERQYEWLREIRAVRGMSRDGHRPEVDIAS